MAVLEAKLKGQRAPRLKDLVSQDERDGLQDEM